MGVNVTVPVLLAVYLQVGLVVQELAEPEQAVNTLGKTLVPARIIEFQFQFVLAQFRLELVVYADRFGLMKNDRMRYIRNIHTVVSFLIKRLRNYLDHRLSPVTAFPYIYDRITP